MSLSWVALKASSTGEITLLLAIVGAAKGDGSVGGCSGCVGGDGVLEADQSVQGLRCGEPGMATFLRAIGIDTYKSFFDCIFAAFRAASLAAAFFAFFDFFPVVAI